MEAVKEKILAVLPNLMQEVVDKLVQKLEKDGVADVEDLEYVNYDDLSGLIKPIEIRKLLKSWTKQKHELEHQESVPNIALQCVDRISDVTENTFTLPADGSWPYRFAVPWSTLSSEIKQLLEKGGRLVGRDRRQLVRVIVEAVRKNHTKHPKKVQLAVIANNVNNKYPNAIADKINGSVIGLGYETFLKQLVSRSENENRSTPNPLKRVATAMPEGAESDEGCSSSSISKKDCVRDSYGCINWQPAILNSEEMVKLKEEMRNLSPTCSDHTFDRLSAIKATFPIQRLEINNGKLMEELLKEWPLLFTESGLILHFEELTGISIKQKLTEAFREKASRIMAYSQHGVKNLPLSRAARSIVSDMTSECEVNSDRRPTLLAVMKLLMLLLGEDEDQLFCVVDEHTHHTEVDLREQPFSPFLVACGDSLLSAQRFMLVVDRNIILPNITSVLGALAVLFAAFYIFNLQYPEGASSSLEFIQRCFIGINPDRGTKACRSKKKVSAMNGKVISLISSLADFEWVINTTTNEGSLCSQPL